MNIVYINNNPIKVNVAITSEEQSNGLMFVAKAEPMAFPFVKSEIKKFWMKNTIVPLDIIFSYKGIITAIFHGKPLSLKHIGPDSLTDLVVELPYNSANDVGAYVGATIKLSYDVSTLAKKFQVKLAKARHDSLPLR